ncbi:MAG: GDSL-type esterase/lipase family protein [bacterium]
MSLTAKKKRIIREKYRKLSVDKLAHEIHARPEEVKSYIDSLGPALEPGRQWLFRAIVLSLPVFFFVLLELGLRAFDYSGNLDLFISAPGEYANYYMCNPFVARRYFFMQSTIPDPPNDLFLKEKPANGYRIFVLGGSTTAGYPYGNNIMFSRILQYRLADVFPEKQIEVINTAMTAVNTYTLLDFVDEILRQQPDAILIYAGHNEFYGALGAASHESLGKFRAFVKLYLKLQRFKTFLLIRNAIGKLRNWIDRLFYSGTLDKPSSTLMERMVGEQTIPLGSPLYELGKRQYEKNLRDILNKAREARVKVLVAELVSNIHDVKPFISVQTDSLPTAESAYLQAKMLEKEGHYLAAKEAYYRAKDLDALRFRATEEFNQVMHRVAQDYRVPVVPVRKYFEAASPHGFIGNNLMLEHLHPNVDGYFLLANAFFDAMRQHGFIASVWDSTRIRPASYYRQDWGFTSLDEAYADLRIRILKGNWPFKPKSVPNRALIDYHPSTKAESLAVKIWLEDGMNLERGHVALAESFEKQRQFKKAFDEYNALLYATPFNVSPYLRAANVLIKMEQLDRALPLLQASLKLEDTAFANKWIGQIYLSHGKTKEAIRLLEKALNMTPKDPQLLYNLSGAYALSAQYERSRKTLKRLEEIYPNFPGASDLKRQLDQL